MFGYSDPLIICVGYSDPLLVSASCNASLVRFVLLYCCCLGVLVRSYSAESRTYVPSHIFHIFRVIPRHTCSRAVTWFHCLSSSLSGSRLWNCVLYSLQYFPVLVELLSGWIRQSPVVPHVLPGRIWVVSALSLCSFSPFGTSSYCQFPTLFRQAGSCPCPFSSSRHLCSGCPLLSAGSSRCCQI